MYRTEELKSMPSFRLLYMFSYNLFQFCGHTWILANTVARFLSFGKDALADAFYAVGVASSLCQLLAVLELFHIADGIEKARLLPRCIQVLQRAVVLVLVVLMEEVQSSPVVCVQLFLWNITDLLRYPHELLCVMENPSAFMLWVRYSLWIPVYVLSTITEGVTVYRAVFSVQPETTPLPRPLLFYLLLLPLGACVTVWQLLKERQHHLVRRSLKRKRR